MAADADENSVTRSLEAYLLWLFGYIMFNNTHGNSVDRILLPYAWEIADGDEDVPAYSWGEAVLAATYRGLCDGCMKTHGNAILVGCLLTLLKAPIYVPQAHRSCSFSLRVFPQGLSIYGTSVLLCLTKH